MSIIYILYTKKGSVSAKQIKNKLQELLPEKEIKCVTEITSFTNKDWLIRYGNTKQKNIDLEYPDRIIQTSDSIINASNKVVSFEKVWSLVSTPFFSRNFNDVLEHYGYPIVGRNDNHVVGEKINIILQKRDLDYCSNDYFLNYIPVQHEFRVYTFNEEVFSLAIKGTKENQYKLPMYMRKNEQCKFIELNKENVDSNPKFPDGTKHIVTQEVKQKLIEYAVIVAKTLNLNFSAMDFILGEDNNIYFLEANTAFGLCNIEQCSDCCGTGFKDNIQCDKCEGTGNVVLTAKRFRLFCEKLSEKINDNEYIDINNIDDNEQITGKRLKLILKKYMEDR